MQVFYPSHGVLIALCFGLWFLFQVGAALLCLHLPNRFFARDTFLTRTRGWEDGGAFYQRVLRIRRWKGFLPDGGALFKSGYAKKRLADASPEGLETFLLESRRAEWTHWLAILPFPLFGLFGPPSIIPMMLLYALAANLPCIIAQRYNRPRIERLLRKRAATAIDVKKVPLEGVDWIK